MSRAKSIHYLYYLILFLCLYTSSSYVLSDDIHAAIGCNTRVYYNDGFITCTLTLENKTAKGLQNIAINTTGLMLEGLTDKGVKQKFFSKGDITATSTSPDKSFLSDPGTFDRDKDLAINDARLSGHGTLTYTISGLVNHEVSSPFTLHSTVNSHRLPAAKIPRANYNYTITASVEGGLSTYKAAGKIVYHVLISNIGKDDIYDARVLDDISSIRTMDASGNDIPAFDSVEQISATTKGTGSDVGIFVDKGNNLAASAITIAAGGWVEYNITAKVNALSVGPISNIATSDIRGKKTDTNKVQLFIDSAPSLSSVISDFLDKDQLPLQENAYMPGGYLAYVLVIDNRLGGDIKDLRVFDDLDNITVEGVHGNKVKAFDSWKAAVTEEPPTPPNYVDLKPNKNIDDKRDVKQGGVTAYQLTVKINEEAVGPITHTFKVNGKDIKSPIATMASGKTQLEVTAYRDRSLKTEIVHYKPSGTVFYRIRFKNTGVGTLYNKQIKDNIKSIKTGIAEKKGRHKIRPTANPFTSWAVFADYNLSSRVTNPGTFKPGNDIDIDATHIAIAPGDYIDFFIKAEVIYEALGDIVNEVFTDDARAQNTLEPPLNSFMNGYDIISIDGDPYFDYMPYRPGGTIRYAIDLTNDSNGWAGGVQIKNPISLTQSDLVDVATQQPVNDQLPFSSWQVTSATTPGDNGVIATYVPAISDNTDIDLWLDIAPKERVILTIDAVIKDTAFGEINHSLPVIDGAKFPLAATPPAPGKPVLSMESVKPPVSKGLNLSYVPGEEIIYRFSIKNTGPGFLDIHVTNAVGSVTDGLGDSVFQKTAFDIESPVPKTSITDLKLPIVDNDLDGEMLIAPNEKYSLLMTGKVKHSAYGPFSTILDTDSGQIAMEFEYPMPTLVAEKKSDIKTYKPGQKITFTVIVKNETDFIALGGLTDMVSDIKILTIDGSEQPVFDHNHKINMHCVIEGDKTGFSQMLDNSDDKHLEVEYRLAGKKTGQTPEHTSLICTIAGVIRDDAVGAFTNKAILLTKKNGKDVSIDVPLGYTIEPSPPSLSIVQRPSKTPNHYKPGEVIGFDVDITNTGDGYATDIVFEDLLANLTTTVAGTHHIEQVIDQWTNVRLDFPTTGRSKAIPGKAVNDKTGYFNHFIIYPGETVSVHLEGQVNQRAMGVIKNTAAVSEVVKGASSRVEADAFYESELASISIDTIAAKPAFFPADTVTFFIKVSNNGTGWASKVSIIDDLNLIQAKMIDGSVQQAFQPDTLNVTHDGTPPFVRMVSNTHNKLDANADIAPGETITFTLVAHLQPGIVGNVTNKAYADHQEAQVTMTPEKAPVNFSQRFDSSVYYVGDRIVFTLDIGNNSPAIASGIHVTDALKDIKVVSADGTVKSALTSWEVTLKSSPTSIVIDNKTGAPFVGTTDKDLDITIDLPSMGQTTLVITGKVIPDAVSDITNTVLLTYKGKRISSKQMIEPSKTTHTVSNKSNQPYYGQGQFIDFTLIIENTSKNILYKQLLVDDMSTLQVDLADGGKGPAFKPGTLSVDPITTSLPANCHIERVIGSPHQFLVTLAPGSAVAFMVKGEVVDDAIGFIQNVANFHGVDIYSDKVLYAPPEVSAKFYTTADYYVPGESVEYHLRLDNTGKFSVHNVSLQTQFSQAKGHYIDGTEGVAFSGWTITAKTDGSSKTKLGTFSDNDDISTQVDIGLGGFIDFTITPITHSDMASMIDVYAHYDPASALSTAGVMAKTDISALSLPPAPSDMFVKKAVTVHQKNNQKVDNNVTYTLTAYNKGKGNLAHVRLLDDLSKIQDDAGNPVFSSWTTTIKENGRLIDPIQHPQPNDKIDLFWNFKSKERNKIEVVIDAIINDISLDKEITNVFIAYEDSGKKTEDTATVHIKTGVGQLTLSKQAKQTHIQPGQAVEYEILIDNPMGLSFENFSIEDHYPAGFSYVKSSATLSYSTANGAGFIKGMTEVDVTDKLVFTPKNSEGGWTQLRLRYVLTASIGVTFGHYKNTAFVIDSSGVISNEASATVNVVGDKLFDTTAIIGKVFEDHNGNGYQSDATAKGIKVQAKVDSQEYISGSSSLEYGSQPIPLKEGKQPAINQGVVIKTLAGQSRSHSRATNKAILRFETRSDKNFPFTVTSNSGSRIVFDSQGRYQKMHSGDVKKGLSNEDLLVTRHLYRKNDRYLWEIHIENIGVYDEGIPGVRLITTEGIKIETDEFGRFHIPDRWVLDKKGQNFTVKVDTGSLPMGMHVISENPKVRRLTPNHLAKFNFSVQSEKNK